MELLTNIYPHVPSGTHYFGGILLTNKLTFSSEMPWKQVIVTHEQFECHPESSKEVFCAITKDILQGVMRDNTDNETCRKLGRNQNISESLDTLTRTFKASFEYHERNHTITSITLIEKLDKFSDAVESKPASNSASSEAIRTERFSVKDEEPYPVYPSFSNEELLNKVHVNARDTSRMYRGKQTTNNETIVMLNVRRKENSPRNDHDFILRRCGELHSPFFLQLIIFSSVLLSGNEQITLVYRKSNSFSSIKFANEFIAGLRTSIERCDERYFVWYIL